MSRSKLVLEVVLIWLVNVTRIGQAYDLGGRALVVKVNLNRVTVVDHAKRVSAVDFQVQSATTFWRNASDAKPGDGRKVNGGLTQPSVTQLAPLVALGTTFHVIVTKSAPGVIPSCGGPGARSHTQDH